LKQSVPTETALWRIRAILKVLNLEQTIEEAIDKLEEPIKTAAKYVWQFGTVVERYSQTTILLQCALQMTDEEVDDLFIKSNNIML